MQIYFRPGMFFAGLLLALGGLAAWMQFGVLSRPVDARVAGDIDYYIENFSSTGADRDGKIYRLRAARLEHFPKDSRARLLRPHIIQYAPSGAARHTYADIGWLSRDGGEVDLSGNVRVVQDAIESPAASHATVRLKGGSD